VQVSLCPSPASAANIGRSQCHPNSDKDGRDGDREDEEVEAEGRRERRPCTPSANDKHQTPYGDTNKEHSWAHRRLGSQETGVTKHVKKLAVPK
jgi:hypothetical protein